jgi:hypothetical protein
MNKALGIVRDGLLIIAGAALLLGMFLGAALQESYKLDPPTAEEIQDAADAH